MNGSRKFQTRGVIIVMLMVCSITTVGVGIVSAQVVNIPDPNLRALIEEELGKAAGAHNYRGGDGKFNLFLQLWLLHP